MLAGLLVILIALTCMLAISFFAVGIFTLIRKLINVKIVSNAMAFYGKQ